MTELLFITGTGAAGLVAGFLFGRTIGWREGVDAQRATTADVEVPAEDAEVFLTRSDAPPRRKRDQWSDDPRGS